MTWSLFPNFNKATNSARTSEINPISQHYVPETLVAVTGQTGAPTTFPYYVDMAGFTRSGFQLEVDGGSHANNTLAITVHGSIQDDGEAPGSGSRDYQDVTLATFGVASISVPGTTTSSDMLIDNSGLLSCFKYVKIEVLLDTSAGANDAGWTIYHKRLY